MTARQGTDQARRRKGPGDYFTEREIADRLVVTLRTVQRWIRAGRFDDVFRPSRGIVRVPYESVVKFEHDYRRAA